MGVIKKFSGRTGGNDGIGLSLKALTAAALILPGLFHPAAQAAEDDEVDFQYSHYQEGKRDILESVIGAKNSANPIEVEGIHGSAKISLSDRIKFAFNYTQDTWGGATPISSAPVGAGGNRAAGGRPDNPDELASGASPFIGNIVSFDKNLMPYRTFFDNDGKQNFILDNRTVHTLSVASPETRKQGDFKLSYDWDEAALTVGGGISLEDDFESSFGSLNGRMDFNQKQTTVNAGISYTNSDIYAIQDHALGPYDASENFVEHLIREDFGTTVVTGNRQDWGLNLGLTQVLSKSASLNVGFNYTRSTGLLENPYKRVEYFFIDPEETPNADGLVSGRSRAYFEQRPDERNQ